MALVQDLLSPVKQKIQEAPYAAIAEAYVRSVRDWCRQTRWFRQSLSSFLVPGQQSYSMGSDSILEVIDVPFLQLTQIISGTPGTIVPLPTIDPLLINPNQPQGQPLAYAYIPENQVFFSCKPDLAYPVTMNLVVQVKDSVAEIPDVLLVKWKRVFEYGAMSYLYGISAESWYNPKEADLWARWYQGGINDGKSDVGRGFQSGPKQLQRNAWAI